MGLFYKKIFVRDEAIGFELVRRYRARGYEIHDCSDGADALDICYAVKYRYTPRLFTALFLRMIGRG